MKGPTELDKSLLEIADELNWQVMPHELLEWDAARLVALRRYINEKKTRQKKQLQDFKRSLLS